MSFPSIPTGVTGLLSQTRSHSLSVTYNNQNFTNEVVNALKEFSYKEGVNYCGDAIQLSIADPEGRLRFNYKLYARDQLSATLQTNNWNYPGEILQRNLGQFEIKLVQIHQDRGGTVVSLHANSISQSSGIRLTKQYRSFETTGLKQVVAFIAKEHKMTYLFNAPDVQISHFEEYGESDLVALQRMCEAHDLVVKIVNNTIFVNRYADLEAKPPIGTILGPTPINPGGINGVGGITSWTYHETTEDIYGSVEIKPLDLKTGRVADGQSTDINHKDAQGNQLTTPKLVLKQNIYPYKTSDGNDTQVWNPIFKFKATAGQNGGSPGQPVNPNSQLDISDGDNSGRAKDDAKNKLLRKNRKRWSVRMMLPLAPKIESGTTWMLQGFGAVVDGKYLLKDVEHKITGKIVSITMLILEKVPTGIQ